MKVKNNDRAFFRLVLSLLCIILYSCEGETIEPDKAGRSLQLHAEIDGLKTRAANASWEPDDAIGIYMVKAGTTLNSSAIKKNAKYVTSGSSSFGPADDADEIIFPFNGSSVDFISYYPYNENINDLPYPVDLTDQSEQAGIDLMYSDNAKGSNSKNPNVRMQFSHQLSKIVLNIVHGKLFDLSDLSVIISNTGTYASFDLATGTLSAATAYGDIALRVDTDGSTAEAILLPAEDISGMDLWFIIGEDTEVYKFPLADALEIDAFEKSTKYTYNVTLFTDETVAITDGNITGWTDGPSENVKAERTEEDPPLIKGSKKSPYTVAEAQVNQGKTDVWVEGFIVGSFAGTINNFFPGNTGTSTTNIAIADTQDETNIDKMIPVNLSEAASAVRNALNIPDNPGNVNRKVKIRGNLENYFSAPGLRNPKEYQFIDPE